MFFHVTVQVELLPSERRWSEIRSGRLERWPVSSLCSGVFLFLSDCLVECIEGWTSRCQFSLIVLCGRVMRFKLAPHPEAFRLLQCEMFEGNTAFLWHFLCGFVCIFMLNVDLERDLVQWYHLNLQKLKWIRDCGVILQLYPCSSPAPLYCQANDFFLDLQVSLFLCKCVRIICPLMMNILVQKMSRLF